MPSRPPRPTTNPRTPHKSTSPTPSPLRDALPGLVPSALSSTLPSHVRGAMAGAVPSPRRGILPSAEPSAERGTLPSTMSRRPTEPPGTLPIRAPITRTSPLRTRVRTPRSPGPNRPRNHLSKHGPPTLRTGLLTALLRSLRPGLLPALRPSRPTLRRPARPAVR